MSKFRGGCYVWRTRKPGAIFGLPFIGRHFGYAGETTSFSHREAQHMIGSDKYDIKHAPWSDLDPKCYRIPLPGWKWLLRSAETVLIGLTWPVYNVRKNRWNPRRISKYKQHLQRRLREAQKRNSSIAVRLVRHAATVRWIHAVVFAVIGLSMYGRIR